MSSARRPEPTLSNVDDHTSKVELDSEMFSHYVLGRYLAVDEGLEQVLKALPEKKREVITLLLIGDTDAAMDEVRGESLDAETDPKRHVAKCGFVQVLLILG
jgi:hypothetical protein